MEKRNKVSIIVPVYNSEQWLRECVNSLVVQDRTHCDLEILLIDDGSIDGSGNICDEFAKTYSYVKTVHKRNQGVSQARNTGLDVASGDWIMFVDSDDILEKNTIKDLCDAEFFKYDVTRFGAKILGASSGYPSLYNKPKNLNDCIRLVIQRRMLLGVWGGVYKKSIFIKNEICFPHNICMGEDWVVFFKLLCNANCFCYLDKLLYGYRWNVKGLSKSVFMGPDVLIAFEKIIDYANKHNVKITQREIRSVKSNLRQKYIRQAVISRKKQVFIETDILLKKYMPCSFIEGIFYSYTLKEMLSFVVYKTMLTIFKI